MADVAPSVATLPSPLPAQQPQTPFTSLPPTSTQLPSNVNMAQQSDEDQRLALIAGMDVNRLALFRQRVGELRAAGHTRETSEEMGKYMMILDLYARAKQIEAQQNAGVPTSGDTSLNPPPQAIPTSTSPASAMTPQQIAQLRTQAASYQLLARNQPIPPHMLQAVQGQPIPGLAGTPPLNPPTNIADAIVGKTIEAVLSENMPKEGMEVDGVNGEKIVTPPYAMEFDESSLIYPYNAYTHPSFYANRKYDQEITNPLTKFQRMLVPSVMPKGLDPYLLMEERNRFIETRMAWRMKELEGMDATANLGDAGAKDVPGIVEGKANANLGIQARIELLSLRLLGKQRLLREDMVRAMHNSTQLPADRNQFRRFRTHTMRDARATETAERRQRTEREQRGRQRHLSYIQSICDHGKSMIASGTGSNGSGGEKMKRLGRAVLNMHAAIEKEEQRRVERLAKERLKALKNDDEDAYMALLGEAKDSRIGHLLKQTDSYLETLAAAVVEQQNDDVHRDQMAFELPFETEDGPASESMFGAKRQDGEEEGAEKKAGKVDYYAVAHRIQEKVTGQANLLTGGKLKDYQVKGLQWMISLYNNRLNGILADEMGLGKTIQTISLITYLIEKKRQPGPFLVIVPLSTLTNWTMEFAKWAPSVDTCILKGSPLQRKEQYERIKRLDFQVCLTTYEYIIKERPLLARINWIHMIIDEGHRMKNVKSKLSQTLNEHYRTRYRLILTGTPLQNNLPELWALLNFVLPKIFNSVKSFDEWFSAPFANTGEKLEMNEEEALLVIKRLHKVLRPFLLRRLKKDVESELPDKVERVIYTKLSALQTKLYESVKKYKTLPMDAVGNGKPRRQANLQNAVMQFRKICNHPFVYREVDEDFSEGTNVDEMLVRSSGKFELLDRILPKLFNTGHKVLIFFQMTEIMTIIADFFDYRGWKYCRLDGGTKADDRQALLSTFNDPASPFQVFILSTRAGGLGLNLQSADTVIIFDTDWNPFADLQAQDRAHRIGQKREVRVLRLITSNTIEEIVLARAQKKLEIDGKIIQAGKFDDVTSGEDYEALLAKAFEQNDEEEEDTKELDDDELNQLLARGEHEEEIFARMDVEREAAKLAAWRAKGNKGPLPPPLMQESELPPFYRRDIGNEVAASELQNEEEQGRGRRTKTEVKYTDGLTDEQWLNAVDASDDDVDDAVDRKRARADKKSERKRMNELLEQAEKEGKPLNLSAVKMEEGGRLGTPMSAGLGAVIGPGKKRGRPSVSATPSVLGDDGPTKRRKVGGTTEAEQALMWRLYNDTNALKSELGEDLNQYFLKPVNAKDYPDYFVIIKKPIAMNQIKKRLKDPHYSLAAFREEMNLVFNNAKIYNEEGSWVHEAAVEMQEFFEKMYAEEVPRLPVNTGTTLPGVGAGLNGGAGGVIIRGWSGSGGGGSGSGEVSGTSTPMYKPQEKVRVPTKLKITLGAGGRKAKKAESVDEEEEEEAGQGRSDSDEDMDDDY